MNTGTGWPFGGPEVTIEEAATKAIFESYLINGGKDVSLDICITDPKEKKRQEGIAKLSRLMAYDGKGKCLDLTSKVNEGKLIWKAPAGEWQLIALFEGKTLQKVKRAAPGGEGYVMDHLNPKAVKITLPNSTKLSRKARPTGHVPSSMILTKYMVPTGHLDCWKNLQNGEDTGWKNIFPNFWMKHVRKPADVSCPIIGKP